MDPGHRGAGSSVRRRDRHVRKRPAAQDKPRANAAAPTAPPMTETLPALRWGLLPLALYLLLAIGAAIVVPSDYVANPRPTPPDEGAHLGYVEYLLVHHALPVFRSEDDNYEGHQPPVYYAACAPLMALLRAVTPGPLAGLSRLGLVLLRCFSLVLAGGSVWLAWLLGRRLFAPSLPLALAVPLFLALLPGRTFIVAAVTNDGLAEAFCLAVFYLSTRLVAEPPTPRRLGLLGVALALALLTKSTSLALVPIVGLALAMGAPLGLEADERAQLRRLLGGVLVVGGIVLVLAGWWFLRNQLLYGDPLAAQVFERLFSKDRATPAYFLSHGLTWGGYYTLVLVNTALSFWGVFGQANVFHGAGYYAAGLLISLLGLVGFAVEAVRRRLRPADTAEAPWQRRAWLLAVLTVALVAAFFLRFNMAFYQAQARYLGAAHGPLASLFVLGLWNLDRRRWGLYGVYAALAVMLIMSLTSVLGFAELVAVPRLSPLSGG